VSNQNLYGEVDSITDLREINRRIRGEIRDVSSRDEITELKKRSDYLCTLTRAPSWQEKLGKRKADRFLQVAKEENARTTRTANTEARRHGIDGDYHAWGSSK
jgi:hypothetical protein